MKNVVEYQAPLRNFDAAGACGGTDTAVDRLVKTGGIYRRVGKRAFDLLLAIMLLPLIAPLIAMLWLAAKRDGGPGFFGHTRITRGGASFKCWKIRTMVMDAEGKLQAYLRDHPEAAKEWNASRKLAKDPRVTRLGDFLRKSSLDELPQIWNVLTGEMSFVGPRPVVADEIKKYGSKSGSYLAQVPGITGYWQVSGRNSVTYGERVAMDHDYLRNMSFLLDLRILLKTWLVVIRRTGC